MTIDLEFKVVIMGARINICKGRASAKIHKPKKYPPPHIEKKAPIRRKHAHYIGMYLGEGGGVVWHAATPSPPAGAHGATEIFVNYYSQTILYNNIKIVI